MHGRIKASGYIPTATTPKRIIEIFRPINCRCSGWPEMQSMPVKPTSPIATAPIASGPSVGANAAAVPVVPHKKEATKIAIVPP